MIKFRFCWLEIRAKLRNRCQTEQEELRLKNLLKQENDEMF